MSNVRLLLVDDDRLVLATLARSLRIAGYEIETAGSGEDALQSAGSAHFDLAVLDIRYPVLKRQIGCAPSTRYRRCSCPHTVIVNWCNWRSMEVAWGM